MEPFAVTCETCRARLKVRSPRVVGQIHACPKCGSMVQIASPAGWSGISQAGPAMPAAEPVSQAAPAGDQSASGSSLTFVGPETPPPPPVAVRTNSLVLGTVGTAALLLVGGLAVATWRSGDARDTPEVAAGSAPAAAAVPPAAPPESPESPESLASPEAPEAVPLDAPATVDGEVPPPAALPSLPALADEPTDADGGLPPVEEPVVEPSSSQLPDASPPADPPASQRPRDPVLAFDPLDFDPAQLSLAASGSPGATPAAGSIADDPDDEPPTLDGNDGAAKTSMPPPAGDVSLAVRIGPPEDAPQRHDAVAQLASPVQAVEIADMPLATFIDLLADLAGVPLTLDPVSLELAGVSPRQPTSVRADETSPAALLQTALSKLRLQSVERDGQIEIVMSGEDRRREVEYDVRDLVGSKGARQVVELIERFVPTTLAETGESTIAVQGNSLRIDHSQSVCHEVLVFCERLRLARGLPLRSRYPAKLVSIEPAYERLAARLGHSTTFTFLPWARLADVLRHWQDDSGLTVLVDWRALAELEIGRSTPVACSAIDRTWEEVLDGTLEPLGLAWWAVDAETIQITTADALGDIQRIEFYDVPTEMRSRFGTPAALIESLESALGQHDVTRAGAEQAALQLDELSGRLIVRAPPMVHRLLARHFTGSAQQ